MCDYYPEEPSTPLTHCLCCGGDNLMPYLDLGNQPAPNDFKDPEYYKLVDIQNTYPLKVVRCLACHHSQLSIAVNKHDLFNNYYAYRTGISGTLREHYLQLADKIITFGNNSYGWGTYKSVLDIGCNDGTLLKQFREIDFFETYGIDPCYEAAQSAKDDIDIFIPGYWPEASKDLPTDKKFDVIVGTNVLAHNDNPKEFLIECANRLSDNGVVVFEFPYTKDLILHCEFDTMYHEHISYFLVGSFLRLTHGTGLYIVKISEDKVHGGSLTVFLKKCKPRQEVYHTCDEALQLINKEISLNLHAEHTYKEFQGRVNTTRDKLRSLLDVHAFKNHRPIGFGASGKSTVMLNYFNIDLDYIIDETPAKQGKLSPGKRILVVPIEFYFQDNKQRDVIIMSWNCMEESLKKLRLVHSKDNAVTYLPTVEKFPLFN